jgi:TetR/AcrR family transcriptional regulator, ethionamide resistance regulator
VSQRARRVSREEARRRIAEAAERLLRDRPFRELTVDSVMTEAGLARTVFYRHFDGLPDLALSLLAEIQTELMTFLASASPEPGDMDFVDRSLELAVDVFDRHGAVIHAVDEASRYDPDVETAYRAFLEGFIEQTARLIEPNPNTPADPRELARALTLMNGNYLIAVLGRERRTDPKTALATLSAVWRATFRPK